MKLMTLFISLMVAVTTLAPAAHATETSQRTVIRFADFGNIRDWRADKDGGLLVEDVRRNWYKATFWGPCHEIRFTESIAFVTEPTGELDKFSSIIANGQRCWFRTFEKVTAPNK